MVLPKLARSTASRPQALNRFFFMSEHQQIRVFDRKNSHEVPIATCRETIHAQRIVDCLNFCSEQLGT